MALKLTSKQVFSLSDADIDRIVERLGKYLETLNLHAQTVQHVSKENKIELPPEISITLDESLHAISIDTSSMQGGLKDKMKQTESDDDLSKSKNKLANFLKKE